VCWIYHKEIVFILALVALERISGSISEAPSQIRQNHKTPERKCHED
jgi:hypothetical protein